MASGNAQDPHQNDFGDDDDFDFGGFEAADPVPEIQGMQAAAQASPWAAFAPGNAQERPDLLCAQNRFPPYLDPSDILGASAGQRNINGNNLDAPALPSVAADLLGDAHFVDARHPDGPEGAENILNPNGRLPDLGLGINDGHLFGQGLGLNMNGPADQALVAAAAVPALLLPVRNVDDSHENMAASPPNPPERAADVQPGNERELPSIANPNDPVGDGRPQAEEGNQQPEEVNQPVEQDNREEEILEMSQQLSSLTERNRVLEEDLERSRTELEAQRSRLEAIEVRNLETVEEVRRAGHEALSVVVEQYKEQLKTVILEQQEASNQMLLETLKEQTTAFQEILQVQDQKYEEARSLDKGEMRRSIEKAVEDTRTEEQEKFQVFLQEEQEKWRKELEKAVERERNSCQSEVQKVLKEEQASAKDRLDEARAEYSNLLEEERKKQEELLATVRQEEAERAREHLSVVVSEERERGRESVREALEAARADTRSYIDEQRQADSRVRQRHLTSLDLFLESCRQQITFLMDSEQNNSGAILKLPTNRGDQGKEDQNDTGAGS